MKRTSTKAGRIGTNRVIRTTVGDLIAAAVDTVGVARTPGLLAGRRSMRRLVRQRLVFT